MGTQRINGKGYCAAVHKAVWKAPEGFLISDRMPPQDDECKLKCSRKSRDDSQEKEQFIELEPIHFLGGCHRCAYTAFRCIEKRRQTLSTALRKTYKISGLCMPLDSMPVKENKTGAGKTSLFRDRILPLHTTNRRRARTWARESS